MTGGNSTESESTEHLRVDGLADEREAAYHQMALDKRREAEALEWAEATIGDVAGDEERVR